MIRTAVIGLGPIGLATAMAVMQSAELSLTGLIDIDPAKAGRQLGELLHDSMGVKGPAATIASPAVVASIDRVQADVLLVCTTSKLRDVAATLKQAIAAKCAVVSSCEEMAFPRYANGALADELDSAARQAGVALLGTGVNPGFVMDLLPVVLASMTRGVRAVEVVRRVDASTRRRPLQAKIGATMTPQQFQTLAGEHAIGHAGIAESAAMLGTGLGHEVAAGSVDVTLEPVLATEKLASLVGEIQPGQVCGMQNVAQWSGAGLSIKLDLTMAIGLADPHDRITIHSGHHHGPLTLTIPGSTPGDSATVASLINGARVIRRQRAGLLTMLDVTPLGCGKVR